MRMSPCAWLQDMISVTVHIYVPNTFRMRTMFCLYRQPPQPSYRNIALMKAGAAEAVTNNERLAYELQAIELEIALVIYFYVFQ